ncbi:MAG: hypothetical protein WB565_13280 [Acidimicrobiales bacterium]
MTEDEFISSLISEFDIEGVPESSTRFIDQLGFDSVNMLDLVLYVEELAGGAKQRLSSSYPVIASIKDAYIYYEDVISIGIPEHATDDGA